MERHGQVRVSDQRPPVTSRIPEPPMAIEVGGLELLERTPSDVATGETATAVSRVDRVVATAEAVVVIVTAATAVVAAVCELARAFQSLRDLRKQRA